MPRITKVNYKGTEYDVGAIDTTLTQSGQAADAKETGDEITGLKGDLNNAESLINSSIEYEKDITVVDEWAKQWVDSNGYIRPTSSNTALSSLLSFVDGQVLVNIAPGYQLKIAEYNSIENGSPTFVRAYDYIKGSTLIDVDKTHFYRLQIKMDSGEDFELDDLPANAVTFYRNIPSISNYSDAKTIYISDRVSYSEYYITNRNLWALTRQSEACALFAISKGYYKITANANFNTIFALLDSDNYNNFDNHPAFIDGWALRRTIVAGTTETIYAHKDCVLYVYNKTEGGDVYFPASIEALLETDTTLTKMGKSADAKYTGEAIRKSACVISNVFNSYSDEICTSGIGINSSGEVVVDATTKLTDFIAIPKKYTKNLLYTHMVANGTYVGSVAFYDSAKEFIESISPNAYITNLDTYAYIRATIPVSAINVVISFSNETLIPQYKKQKQAELGARRWFDYEKNVVSDGCMTAMIQTALRYANSTVYGYGTEHTAFAESCIKTTKDTHTSSSQYEGERYQIDCSTYVQLILLGIVPECSRYFHAKNIPAFWGYVFNALAEYEGYVYGVAQTGNTKRLYANSIAEYAYKNGFLYAINDDFSNVKAGDILFTSNQSSSYHFFENIGHCAFVYNVIPLAIGGNAVETFEATGTDTPCTKHTYTSRDAKKIYGARFPFNYVKDVSKDIASFSNQVEETISGNSGVTFDIATVPLAETLKKFNVYTAVIDSNIISDGYFKIAIDGASYTGYRNENVLVRPDGKTIIRFVLFGTYTASDTNIKVQFVSTDNVSENIIVKGFNLYNGYVTV